MNAPYRRPAESPFFARERALEQELADTRFQLDAYSNEELRIARRVRLRQATGKELFEVRAMVAFLAVSEQRLESELEAVRAEIVARGERKVVRPSDVHRSDEAAALVGILVFTVFAALGFLLTWH